MSFLFCWGSAQSRDRDVRLEAEVDALLRDRGIDDAAIDDAVVNDVSGRATGRDPAAGATR